MLTRYDPFFHRGLGYSIVNWRKLREYATVKGGKRITLGDSYAHNETGLYYLRVDNLSDHGQIVGELKWVSPETFKALERYRTFTGDVLVSIAGTIGRTTVFDESLVKGPTILTENCARLKAIPGILPEYLMLLLASKPIQAQMERDYIQTTIPKLGLDRIRQLRVPAIPQLHHQQKVVDYWQAALNNYFGMLNKAAGLVASIDDYMLSELGFNLPPKPENTIASRMFAANRKELVGWRFDPQALHPEREACIAEIRRQPSYPLRKVAAFFRELHTEIPDWATYVGLENIESNTGRYVPSIEKESISSAFGFYKGQVLFPKLRPYLNKVFLAPFDGLCSTEFHVLEGATVRSDFLALFLRSKLVVKQTKHLTSGNTLPRLQTEDIEMLLIPTVDNSVQQRIVVEAEHRMDEAERLRADAEEKIESAKRRIEAMLLGKLE
jgi:restriction endonuclease S subunit